MAQPLFLSRCSTAAVSSRRLINPSAPLKGAFATPTSLRQNIYTSAIRPSSNNNNNQRLYQCPHPTTATPSINTRLYHSKHHPDPPPHEYTNSQTTILSAALNHVPEHGFTLDSLTLGARDVGFLDVSVQLFPRRELDLIFFWLASRRGLLRGKVENGLFENLSVTDSKTGQLKKGSELSVDEKVKILLLERLRMNSEIRHQWQDALALMSFPSNIPLSLSELHALSSDILTLAGDASVDAEWYSKRLSVSAVYASAEVVLTRDETPGFADTQAFVERRLEDCNALGGKIGDLKQCLGFMGSTAVGLGRSWGLKI